MEELIQKVARLESLNDFLISELAYIDELARKVGFEKGIKGLKDAALELIEEDSAREDESNPPMAC